MISWKSAECSISISIDSYEEKNPVGRFWHGERETEVRFTNLMQLLLGIESLLQDEQNLNESPRFKSFSPPDFASRGEEGSVVQELPFGKLATLQLKIIFRQHASWQGTIAWVESRQERTFRSVLEMAILLDSALSQMEILNYRGII